MIKRFFWWNPHLNIVVLCGVLLGAFVFQFTLGELPCPLCMLQRMAMMLCALGQAFILLRGRREGHVEWRDFAAGLGMTALAAVAGMAMSTRQILLHIVPPDPGYGTPVMGLHVYTWALLVFVAELLAVGVNLVAAPRDLEARPVAFGRASKLVIALLAFVIAANLVVVLVEEGFHWTLPDNPVRYQLLYDLGLKKG